MKNIKYWAHEEIELLSIDIDGNDFHILDKFLSHHKPAVICFEVNSQLPLDLSIVMPYKEDHVWDGSFFYGMSYLAGEKLCDFHGYTIYDVVNKTNIIAVRSVLAEKVKPKNYAFESTWSHPENEKSINDFQKI